MSDTTPDMGETTETPEVGGTDTGPDWKAEAEKWQALARKHEDRAKSNATAAKELERYQQQSMTEQERAVAEARAEARSEALREAGKDRVDDAVRLAAKGRHDDPDALLVGLDRAAFLDEDGRPDTQAITAWMDRVAPEREPAPEAPTFDFGQGTRAAPLALNGDPLERALRDKLGVR
jgi:hypothetical protein